MQKHEDEQVKQRQISRLSQISLTDRTMPKPWEVTRGRRWGCCDGHTQHFNYNKNFINVGPSSCMP